MSGHPIHHNPKAIFHVETRPFTRRRRYNGYFNLAPAGRIALDMWHRGQGPGIGLGEFRFLPLLSML